jgi:hypothetical protein
MHLAKHLRKVARHEGTAQEARLSSVCRQILTKLLHLAQDFFNSIPLWLLIVRGERHVYFKEEGLIDVRRISCIVMFQRGSHPCSCR